MTEPQLATMEREFDERVRELEPFDACAWIGYPTTGNKGYPDYDALRAALDEQHISRALLSHTSALLYDPMAGNKALAEIVAAHPGTGGVMFLIPPGTGEFDDAGDYIDEQLAVNLRAARLCPKHHRFSLKLPAVSALLSALEERGVPLFIPIGQTSWDEIGSIAMKYPKLAILVEGAGHHEYLNIRTCLSWLESAPNLLVPTNRQFLSGGLELMVERLGAHRVLFATDQPKEDPASALALLTLGQLPPETRQQIAHGNLDRLLAGVGHGGYFA